MKCHLTIIKEILDLITNVVDENIEVSIWWKYDKFWKIVKKLMEISRNYYN